MGSDGESETSGHIDRQMASPVSASLVDSQIISRHFETVLSFLLICQFLGVL